MLFPHLSRRRFLSASATLAGAGVLQACSAPAMPVLPTNQSSTGSGNAPARGFLSVWKTPMTLQSTPG